MHKSSAVSQQISCSNYILLANVGVGTTEPRTALDVNGYVRMGHCAFGCGGAGGAGGAGGEVVVYNIGGCFNAATREFTCPVQGIYLFSGSGMMNATSGAALGAGAASELCCEGDVIVGATSGVGYIVLRGPHICPFRIGG